MCRGKDSRSNLDNLANAALMASQSERAARGGPTAPAAAVPTSKGPARIATRPPKKKTRSGSLSGGAASSSPTSATHSPASTISGPMSAKQQPGSVTKFAHASEPAVTSRHTASMQASLAPAQEGPVQSADNGWQALPEGVSFSAAQAGNVHTGMASDALHDPIAAAIKNATDAITTDGAMQASGDLAVHGLQTQPQISQDIILPHASIQAGTVSTDQGLPQHIQLSYQLPSGEMALDNQPNADGTVTITTSQTTPEGATVLVRQPEGLLIVRDPESGKEQCLGKLLGNSRQTSLILQAANFLEPCSN